MNLRMADLLDSGDKYLRRSFVTGLPPTVSRGIVYVGTDAGHVFAIADPLVRPPVGLRCSQPDIPSALCAASGYQLVPDPAILADVTLNGSIHTEPVLVGGKVYVSTDAGFVYMLTR